MAGNEDHRKNPSRDLIEALVECGWQYVGPGLWEKGESRLFVDHIGVFLYRRVAGLWKQTHGLSYSRIIHLPERVIRFDADYSLDLLTGL